jgi:hypothetical protein
VKNYLDAVERFVEQLLIGDTAFDKFEVAAYFFDIFTVTSREVVEHAYSRAFCHECCSNVGADEACSSRYESDSC